MHTMSEDLLVGSDYNLRGVIVHTVTDLEMESERNVVEGMRVGLT